MRAFAEQFYLSQAWRNCRDAYMESVGGLCEECLKQGVYTPAEIVHHIKPLTERNINDPEITLSFKNLYAVCRSCHAKLHGAKAARRYKVDETGHVTVIE